jgi:uncharacterized protein involved in outer membrane biogenesis
MNAKIKKVFFILGGSAGALVLAAVIFVLTFNINPYKPRIETAASLATGMKVRINGNMKLTLFPLAGVSLEDIRIQNRGVDVASVKKVEADIRLLPLLRQEVHIKRLGLISPAFFITKDKSGHFNIETPEKKPAGQELPPGPFKAGKIVIRKGHLSYTDETSGSKAEANECELSINNFSVGEGKFPLTFDGDLSCGEVKEDELRISDIRAAIVARQGMFEADPITMKIFGGDGRGSIRGVMTGKSPGYSVDFTIAKLRFEEVLKQFKREKSILGGLDLKLHLTMKGKSPAEIKRSVQGDLSLRGQDLFYEGLDLDRVLEKYEKSQNFNLVDVGAFFVAGPLGTLLTRGYNFGSVYEASMRGKSTIQQLVSDWKVKDGVAEAEDVAFSTTKSRVALKGRLDFVNEQFDNVTVAVLDEKGCVKFSQKIHGPFHHPLVDKVSTLRSIAGPVLNLFKKTEKLLTGGECEIFYRGSVPPPK